MNCQSRQPEPLWFPAARLQESHKKFLGVVSFQLRFGMPLDSNNEASIGGFYGFHDAIG